MTDPRREGEGRDPKTTMTPKTDPDTGAGHRSSTEQTERPAHDRGRRPADAPEVDRDTPGPEPVDRRAG